MNPRHDRERVGYLRGIADTVRGLVAVARARKADLRALRQVPHQLKSAKAEVLLDRAAELDSLSRTARAQFRNAVVGRSADHAGQRGRAAVAARAAQMADDALEAYRHAAGTPASWNREPRSHPRADAASDDTDRVTADADRATRGRDSASNDRDSDEAGTGLDDDPGPPWETDAAAVVPDRATPLANWPLWQDAQRVRDPDLVAFSAVVDEVVADAPDSAEWGRWFDENDSLAMLVEDVLEDRRRDTEYRVVGDNGLDTDDRADSVTDLDAGPRHEDPVAEPTIDDTAGGTDEEAPASPAVVPDPLEQARHALDGIAADLARDRWDSDPRGCDRGDSAADRDGSGHDPDDGDHGRYDGDDGRADPW
ncbi:hypothetical protein SAMN05216207_101225 [Pseudonocardia ammonioxydans]|uniref:Uncharacterized protein n=1 Tax=Pseudonocardia ammonioxydans TaxID=260086 RepID=A0A1I4XWM4_PSUAM|nr:hypothetical protein [Pseudonocardia ammonioxydans]SFN30106.1 hypothetical protein SAMN05216207_101225 [Pseudonocardia ammonioxydans]